MLKYQITNVQPDSSIQITFLKACLVLPFPVSCASRFLVVTNVDEQIKRGCQELLLQTKWSQVAPLTLSKSPFLFATAL